MPNWQPNWEDVAFDYGLAAEAAAECRSSARVIDAVLDGMARAAPEAQADWNGRLAEDFAVEEFEVSNDLKRVKDDLEQLARQIEDACDYARDEQRRREDNREWWREE